MRTAPPDTVYAPDIELSALTTAERLLVGTLRLFALPSSSRRRDEADWSRGLAAAGVGDRGIAAFHRIFAVVATAGSRPLDVHRLACAVLGADEARLLQVIGLLQRGSRDGALAILSDWLPMAPARLATAAAGDLAMTLAKAGLIVPHRHREASAIADGVRFYADPGLLLVQ